MAKWRRREDGEAERALHAEAGAELVDEAAPDVSAEPTEAVLPADLSDIGAEVGAVLKSAQEAAARIRNRAAKLGEAAAEAQIAEAQRVAAENRAEGERIRAEAQLYASKTRADAETFAEQTRMNAEREAAKIVGDLTANARERFNTLEAGSRRQEERLEHMRVVFHGMTSQLEELLGERDAERGDADPQDEEDLADALQPDSVSPRTR
jgi:hypothetical protein